MATAVVWTKADVQKLLAALRSSIPEKYKQTPYLHALKVVDWEKVAFPPFSPEACQIKWKRILNKMRKVRSIIELLNEAESDGDPSLRKKKKKKRAQDRFLPPKPPQSGYRLFCKEQEPLMSGSQDERYVTVWAQRWRQLTEEEKSEYSKRCNELRKEYLKNLKNCLSEFNEDERQQIMEKNRLKPKTPLRLKNLTWSVENMEANETDGNSEAEEPTQTKKDRPRISCRTSDSEDEDVQDSSSDEQTDLTSEEDEDDNITFDMY